VVAVDVDVRRLPQDHLPLSCTRRLGNAQPAPTVSLPHSSRQQFNLSRPVAKSDLQLGDLVFFYSDIHHVGLYAGRGQVIHAPRPGKSVEYIKMSYMPYAGARRPG
jgi:peptidoglycan DL-endopeptidase CwlO